MRYVCAGEADGQALVAVVHDVPAGLRVSKVQAESDLKRAQNGYGLQGCATRFVDITSGIYDRKTTGAPVSFLIYRDQESKSGVLPGASVSPSVLRPGRGDLPGMLKTAADALPAVANRLDSCDELATVVAASVPREFLAGLGVEIMSYVNRIGSNVMNEPDFPQIGEDITALATEFSPVRCPSQRTSDAMCADIEKARRANETLGGTFRLVVTGLVAGLGGFAQRSDRLTTQLSAALFALPYVVGVEFGAGFALAQKPGSSAYDQLSVNASKGFSRQSNYAGGVEDGMSTGEPLVITVAVAPPPCTGKPLSSIDIDTLEQVPCVCTEGPVCVVPGVAVAAEAELAFVLASAYARKFGADNMADTRAALDAYVHRLRMAAR